mmetsp:Transcript_81979/g.217565  ORF Transcript_81979/g.217565 Transcript_81979/m.217565 type:complete len:230 (+) Transcript_81979:322-1011(+)|eukprot:CAMPEP_0171154708 /NCGR_PEP_ID=MMETSP0790-20130122/481_1 /TAXON_ID=2925 /ORGANISM="Alexandrium catenella, Strain OF101" /LENGTH=229 /DNA_ID=CAMNT_0011618819 /DNA_START=302 /DNA_END=991 /DNA_ORIENTATION=+
MRHHAVGRGLRDAQTHHVAIAVAVPGGFGRGAERLRQAPANNHVRELTDPHHVPWLPVQAVEAEPQDLRPDGLVVAVAHVNVDGLRHLSWTHRWREQLLRELRSVLLAGYDVCQFGVLEAVTGPAEQKVRQVIARAEDDALPVQFDHGVTASPEQRGGGLNQVFCLLHFHTIADGVAHAGVEQVRSDGEAAQEERLSACCRYWVWNCIISDDGAVGHSSEKTGCGEIHG